MTLRNAFDSLSTESALRKIASLLTFSRDTADRIRVVVDTNNAGNSVFNRGANTTMTANDLVAPFTSHSWNIQDARETQRIQMRLNADMTRKNRWTY